MKRKWYNITVEKLEEGDKRDEYQILRIGKTDYKVTEAEEALSEREREELAKVVKKLIRARPRITHVNLELELS